MAQSTVIYNISLNDAVQKLLDQMEKACYSEKTRHNTFLKLRPIQTFMDMEMITEYSPNVGEKYLESYFSTHKAGKRFKLALIHTIGMLNDSYNGVPIIRKKSSVIYNESLALLINNLINQLQSVGYAKDTQKNYVRRLRPIQTFMQQKNIDTYSPEVGDAFYEYFLKTHRVNEIAKQELKSSIARLNDVCRGIPFVRIHTNSNIDAIPLCYSKIVDEFFNDSKIYSSSKSTTSRRTRALARFLTKCINLSVWSVNELTPQIVSLACADVTNTDDWITIRQFMKFLAQNENTKNDLSTFVPKFTRAKTPPSTYSIEEIQAMENSVDRSTLQGKRDYAILLMVTRLAMRVGDIAKIKRENLDFNNETISFIQQKTNVEITLPMIPILKNALTSYLKVLVANDDYIFHSIIAPHSPITSSIIFCVVNKYLIKAGINTSEKKHGPHAFRATAATSMINDDIPYDAVRSILGHTSVNSIKYYAKNDIEKLRRCAISVPGPTGNFDIFLNGGVKI